MSVFLDSLIPFNSCICPFTDSKLTWGRFCSALVTVKNIWLEVPGNRDIQKRGHHRSSRTRDSRPWATFFIKAISKSKSEEEGKWSQEMDILATGHHRRPLTVPSCGTVYREVVTATQDNPSWEKVRQIYPPPDTHSDKVLPLRYHSPTICVPWASSPVASPTVTPQHHQEKLWAGGQGPSLGCCWQSTQNWEPQGRLRLTRMTKGPRGREAEGIWSHM